MGKKPRPIESFGGHIRRLRIEAGLTVEQAAGAGGMSPSAWLAMEEQDASPRLRMLRPIAAALDIEPHEVL